MTAFITTHRESFGDEPICTVLQTAPSTYYDTIGRTPTRRAQHDEVFKVEIRRVHEENHGVYGVDKVWHQLHREGWHVGRDRVARLMRALGLKGVVRGKRTRTTVSKESDDRPADLVDRKFTASAPNCLWVADITYVSIWSGFAYVAFIIDVFSRRIMGRRVSTSLHAELALDAIEMAIWSQQGDDLAGLVHHADRLADEGAVRSVGSRGDSYDNALAETVNGLYKAEVIWRSGPWRSTGGMSDASTLPWATCRRRSSRPRSGRRMQHEFWPTLSIMRGGGIHRCDILLPHSEEGPI